MHGTELGGFSALPQDVEVSTPFPLTPAQLGVWYAQLLDPDVPITIAQYVDLVGDLDVDLFRAVSTEAAHSYGSSLIRLGEADGVPFQYIDHTIRIEDDLPLIDLRDYADPIAAAHDWMRAEFGAPIDMLVDRLVTGAILRVADQRWFWYLRGHHIVLDGYGAFTNSSRIAELYTARTLGVDPAHVVPGALADLVDGEQRYRDSTRFVADRAHWAERIAGVDSPTSLDLRTAPRSANNIVSGGVLSTRLVERLETIAASDDSALSVVLLAAFAAYLGRLTDRPDAVLSLPVTARTTAVMRRSAGMLSNIVPLRLPTGGAGDETTWRELLRAARVEVAGALRHQRYRAEDIRRDAEDDGRPARRALFGPLANFMLFRSDLTLGDVTGRYHVLSTGPIEDLSLNVYYGDRDRVHLDFEANPNLYDADTLARHHSRFLAFLDRLAAADLATPLADIAVATELESLVSTRIWNATNFDVAAALDADGVADQTLAAMFVAQVARTPDAVAIRMGDENLTYRELDARANQLSRHLRDSGIGPESLVALSIRRSVDLVVAMYAVVAAGAAYVPIDPDHPADRIGHILTTAAPAAVLTTTRDGLPVETSAPVIAVDAVDLTAYATTPLNVALHPDNTAYVIFTSGSTGMPKGVAVTHAAIVNRLVWMQRAYRLGGNDVVLQKTPMTFDVSVWEFFWPLQIGATLALAEHDGHRDPAYLRQAIADYGVTVAHFVPSMLDAFLAQGEIGETSSLHTVFASGEALPAPLAQRLRLLTGARLHNLYGPTEAAVDVTFHEVTDADRVTVPIGAPVYNTRLHVLDSRLRPVPIGAPGELYLSGVQLARGYFGRPDLTAGRFIADPSDASARMYRTGDLVRWTATGELEYLGRTDFQVKLRGLRIELGEIEAVLESVDGAARAVVLVRDDAGVGEQLVAYVVAAEPGAVTVDELRDAGLRALPAYMVPAAFVLLDALPVSAAGKLDRKALPAPERVVVAYAEPVGPVEEAVARVFAEVLGAERIGREDDFFVLGGNSLVATQVAARLGADLGCQLGVRDLFGAPTVTRLAAVLAERLADGVTADLPALVAGPRPALIPLSPAQQRIWFINRFDPSAPGYNMPFVVRIKGSTDLSALNAALAQVVARHEALRTVFPAVTGPEVAEQVVLPADSMSFGAPIVAEDLDAELTRFANRGFDLAVESPFRAQVFVTDSECALAVVLHHIAADGVSLQVLVRDVLTAYRAVVDGVAPAWAPLSVQYADYSLWQRALLGSEADAGSLASREIAFWERTLAHLPDQLELPSARTRPTEPTLRGARHHFTIDVDLHRDLAALAAREGASLFMVLHTALAVLLSRMSGTADIAIGTGVAGRGDRAIDDLIGMFVNTLVLRTEVDPAAPFTTALGHTREVDLAAFAHATVPFDRLVDVVNPARSQSRHPLFQVALNFQAVLDTSFDIDGVPAQVHEIALDTTKFDLQFTLAEHRTDVPSGIDAEVLYATDLFDCDDVAALGTRFVELLTAAAAAPHTAVGDLALLSEGEYARLTAMSGGPVSATGLLPDLLAAAVAADPERVAVTDGVRSLSYRELDRASSRLARVLIDGGIGPDDIVAVGVPRSIESVLAVWAVAKSGAAWLPVDPSYPLDRITHMITDSGARVGLTVLVSAGSLPDSIEWLVLDELKLMAECAARASDPVADAERVRPLRAGQLAYVIYTSGSTGLPKGVLVTQAGIAGFAAEESDRMFGTPDARVLQVGSPSFDISVMELLLAVNSAATLVIAPTGQHVGAELAQLLSTQRVTHVLITPSALSVLDPATLPDLRMIMVGGEACPRELVGRWTSGGVERAFVNAYGPSETTIATNISAPLTADAELTLGLPLRGIREWVLDSRLQPVPVGVAGELYVAGAQLARGYRDRADLTFGRFVACPWAPGERMYRTGDLVRWTTEGTLEYLGRNDDQVKLRGFRIELGEIEGVLAAQDAVRSAVVVVRSDAHRGDHLVAYVVPNARGSRIARPDRVALVDTVDGSTRVTAGVDGVMSVDTVDGSTRVTAGVDGVASVDTVDVSTRVTAGVDGVMSVDTVDGSTRVTAGVDGVASADTVDVSARITAGAGSAGGAEAAGSGSLDVDALLTAVRGRLAAHMVPSAVVVLDELPLTPNGKLDRRALPEPVYAATEFRAPAPGVETVVASVFADVLGVELVGADDDFFALGGNSLIATQVASRLGAALNQNVSLRTLFEAPTVAGLAAAVQIQDATAARRPLVAGERPAHVPLSYAQQRMWFMNQFDADSVADNIAAAIRLTGQLNEQALRSAIADVVARHESLRTRYPSVNGIGYQEVLSPDEVGIELIAESLIGDADSTGLVASAEATNPSNDATLAAADASAHADAGRVNAQLIARIRELAAQPFAVGEAAPVRLHLIATAEDEHVLVLVVHHIAADGWSVAPLTRDVMVAYAAHLTGDATPIAPLAVQYADFTLWQRETLGDEDDPQSLLSRQIDFWTTELAELPDLLELPTDRPRPAVATGRGARTTFDVTADLATSLRGIATSNGASLFMVMHAAFAATLAKLSGQRDIAVGTPVAGRGDQALDGLVGMFVNTLVLRSAVAPSATFAELLTQVRDGDLRALANADVTFDRLVEVLNPVRSTARHPLFQVLIDFQNNSVTELALAGLTASEIEIDTQTAKFDLQLTLRETDSGIAGRFEYATDLFDAQTVTSFGTRFVRMLEEVAADPSVVIGDIDLLSDTERADLTHNWAQSAPDGGTGLFANPEATLADLVDAMVAEHGDRTAVKFGDESLTYSELDRRANTLARKLIGEGAGPGQLVAVILPRSLDLVVALLAVVKSGAGYVPIDPTYPADRIAYVLSDAAPASVIVDGTVDVELPANLTVVSMAGFGVETGDLVDAGEGPITDADRIAPLHSANTAYVIYTSGSTGRPKGVVVAHSNVVKLFANTDREFGFGPDDVWTMFHSSAFDFSVWELWGALLYGGTVVVVDYYVSRSPEQFLELLSRENVTVLNQTPSAFYQLAEVERTNPTPLALRYVVFGGEALELSRLRDWMVRNGDGSNGSTGPQLVNMYGITETTVHVTHRVLDLETVTNATGSVIGKAIAGLSVYVLDTRLNPVPVGVPGEIYVAGPQLTNGYLGREELSIARFVANPFTNTGERLYRSGDLGRWNAAGELEHLGRADDQVKVRGFRIELGEIEAALLAIDAVTHAAVIVRNDNRVSDQLVGYVVTTEPVDTEQLRAQLGESLPAYMVPSVLMVLDALPLTVNGKLDRKALPVPTFATATFRAPQTPTEQLVAQTFADLLAFPADREVGLDDDFFAIGGNSLTATQVMARLGAALDTQLPVRVLFEAPTVAALAAECAARSGSGGRAALVASPRPERIPLSAAQRRMWFLNRYFADADIDGPGDAVDNIPVALRLTGTVDAEALGVAWSDVLTRHEILRTTYPDGPAGPEQVILPVQAIRNACSAVVAASPDATCDGTASSASVADAAPATATDDSAEPASALATTALHTSTVPADAVEAHVLSCAATRFDLTTDVPVRANLLSVDGTNEHVLVLVIHHISADGFSLGPLAADLMAAYAARTTGTAPTWAELPVQYADYALWQAETLGDATDPDSEAATQLAHWTTALAGLPEQLELPTDRPRPVESTFRGATHRFTVDSDLHSELRELARKYDATLFSTIHAALAVLLARLSGGSDIAIGTPVAGRGDQALDGLVGMFVNTLVLRSQIDPRAEFESTLDAVRAADIDALSHADLPFEQIVDAMNISRARNRHPLFQVALVLQNFTVPTLELPELTVAPIDFDAQVAKFDLQFTVNENADVDGRANGMSIEIGYATDLYDNASVATLARRFTQVLSAVVADPTVVVGDIQLLSAEEQQRALYDWASTGEAVTADETETLVARFAKAAAANPDAVAVKAGENQLTYAELDVWSNRLARRLIGAGVGPETLVAVAMPRTIELAVALLSVLKAGAGYLPIDPNYPADRIEYLIDDARPLCAIANTESGLPRDWFGGPVLDPACGNLLDFAGNPITDADRRTPLTPGNTAYVIYTSGSTGRPKGVVIPHANVIALLDNTARHFAFGPDDVWTMFHSYAFDFSVWELWGALLHGSSVVLVDYFTSRSPEQFRDLLRTEGVTVLNQTPSAFYQLIAADLASEPTEYALRTVIFGGEALEPQRLAPWFARYGTTPQLVNMYGITETTVHVSYREITPETGSASVIGGAIAGLTVRVLDSRLRPVPVGVPGEIYVSGTQLARGYLARPDLTASRFVADPYGAAGTLTYRTGDLARWTADGDLEYLGRADQQVNLRGFRIELGEIEAALLTSSLAPREVAVIVRTDLVDEPRIVAYAVADTQIDTAALKLELARTLPEHMLPAAIVSVDRIPLTVNGKLDRAALPAPVFETTAYRKPTGVAEEIVAGVFAEVLGLDLVGADDDFFAIGGSSLLAAKAAARIGSALDRRVGVRTLFESPRVADLAAAVAALASGDRPALVGRERPAALPLSPAQQRMWFLNRFDRASVAYNIPFALRLTGDLNVAAFTAAVGDVIARHESLRTHYPEVDGSPVQVIMPTTTPDLTPMSVSAEELPSAIGEVAMTTFDVTSEVPVLLRLFQLDETEFVLAAVLHHIAADGSSITPFVADLMRAYTARLADTAPGWTPPAVQFADYALWQREMLGEESDANSVAAQQVNYWANQLKGLPDQLALPTDRPRPARQSMRGDKVTFTLDADVHAALVAVGRRSGATLFMVVHAAFAALLARLSGTTDIAVGTPIAGRGEPELDEVIGMFANTIVLRTEVDAAQPFTELLESARGSDIAALGHADVPFERLVEVLNPARSTARHPLFQVGYSFQNHERRALELPGLTVEEVEFDAGVAQFDLHLFAKDNYSFDGSAAGIELVFGYATDLFDAMSARRFAAQLTRIFETVAATPETVVGDLDLLGPDAAQFAQWNETARPVEPATLASMVADQAARTPAATALATNEGALDYATFDARVNTLAHHLIGAGVGPERTVVLSMQRSVDLVIAMHAVVRAGGAYVPIDPTHPADRIAYIIETSSPVCVLTTVAEGVPVAVNVPVIEVDGLGDALTTAPITDADRIAPLRPEHPAYVIFTSGSTGLPKGVAIPHNAIVNQIAWLHSRFEMTARDRVVLKTPSTFDVSVWEFWGPLTIGATLVVAELGAERDPDLLRATMAAHDITILCAVPSLVTMLLANGDRLPESLRAVLAIGEALPVATAHQFRLATDTATLYNTYGPTEAAVSITEYAVEEEPTNFVSIGGPLWNSAVHVLDSRLRPVPVGVAGELYLAGVQLARGYFGRHALTSDRFVANPFGEPGERMYRTGDVVRWHADGTLEYLGRVDFQVKIGGFRIELGEIETAMLRCPNVRAAVAVAKQDDNGARLVAYATVDNPAAPGIVEEIRAQLTADLPAYMVPSALVILDEFPFNSSGKVDRGQLPEPEFANAEFRAPVTELEQLVAATFIEVIGCATAGLDDDFFAVGGNSLTATRVAGRLSAALGAQVPVAAVFETPTVAALAARLETLDRGDKRPALVKRTETGPAVLSPAQQRMWVLHQLAQNSAAYHIPAAIRLTGDLNLAALRGAVADVLARHDTLRTRYPDTADGPVQQVMPAWSNSVDLEPISVSHDDIMARVSALVAQPFDITAAPPVRVALYRLAPDEHALVVVVHHISADGYSVAPLVTDLVRAYVARNAGVDPEWTPLEIQYADFSVWQRDLLGDEADPDSVVSRQLTYWTRELAGAPELLALPTDRPRAARREMRAAAIEFDIDAQLTHRLDEVARDNGTTLFTVVHSALAVLLAKLSGSSDITIGVPVAGRGARELDDLVGMFVNTVALRTEIESRGPFTDLLAQAKRRDLAALANADVPFEQIVDAMGRPRTGAFTPLFQVMLTFQNMPPTSIELPGLTVEPLDPGLAEAKFDLHPTILQRYDTDGVLDGLDVAFGYATDIFDESTIVAMTERFRSVLTAIAADPTVAVRAIDVRTAAEKTPPKPRLSIADLPTLVGSAARIAPQVVAFTHGDHEVSYGALDAKLTAVRRSMGAAMKPEALVNVALAGLVPGVLAALGATGLTNTLQTLITDAAAVTAGSGPVDDSEGTR
ncbi:non-ribosomal peptide synthase/polyketide synthase [Nocardia camponoti]|uniref:Carrier domain-containing protein n=1 Tax=Nocardia camponoti TaxID=1616106 RepID=A0A917QG61_9NOCA|nr:non-ribosomal peptide synthase/polyketide synthase [Nocardia camponoti]GGK49803.1 hypothetical protein GCM10011591_21650 [Nocardia camponoti]